MMVCSAEPTTSRSVFIGSRCCYAVLFLLISLGNVVLGSQWNLVQRERQVQDQPRPQPADPTKTASRHDFDWQLSQQVFRNEDANVVFSPFSVRLLLTMLYEASEVGSTTRQQLETVLCEQDLNETRVFYNEFLQTTTKPNPNYEFDIGTKVFLDKQHGKLSPNYTELLEQTYSASFDRVSFKRSKATADQINDWCGKVTRGRITEIVSEETLLESQMILANVLFLKASWRNSFLDRDTSDKVFHIGENATVTTPFMTQTDLYDYVDHNELGAEVLRMPYKGRDFSMNIILPYPNVSLDALANALSTSMLSSFRFMREDVTILIPKFRFNYGTQLNEPLQNLGIRDIFNRNASLPYLAPVSTNPEKSPSEASPEVSKILQKAGIEINEKGTLASAATEIQLVSKFGYDDRPVVFNANRPFLFYIHDQQTDTILFVGKVMDPTRSTAA